MTGTSSQINPGILIPIRYSDRELILLKKI